MDFLLLFRTGNPCYSDMTGLWDAQWWTGGSISCKWLEEAGAMTGVIPVAGENVPSPKDGNWAQHSHQLLGFVLVSTHACAGHPPTPSSHLLLEPWFDLGSNVPDPENPSRLVQVSPVALFHWPMTHLWEGLGLSWPMRCDRKSPLEMDSPVKGGLEKSPFAITSLALCIGHCHARCL